MPRPRPTSWAALCRSRQRSLKEPGGGREARRQRGAFSAGHLGGQAPMGRGTPLSSSCPKESPGSPSMLSRAQACPQSQLGRRTLLLPHHFLGVPITPVSSGVLFQEGTPKYAPPQGSLVGFLQAPAKAMGRGQGWESERESVAGVGVGGHGQRSVPGVRGCTGPASEDTGPRVRV